MGTSAERLPERGLVVYVPCHPPLQRVLRDEFPRLLRFLVSKNTPAPLRPDREFERDLYLAIVGGYHRFLAEWTDPEPPSEEACANAARRLISTEFYRLFRREVRERLRVRPLADLTGRRGEEAGGGFRVPAPGLSAAGEAIVREAFRRFRTSLSPVEGKVLEYCSRREFWMRSGKVNYSLVSRACGVGRKRVRRIYDDLVDRARRLVAGDES